VVAGVALGVTSEGPIVPHSPLSDFLAALREILGVVGVLIEAGAALGGLLDVLGDRLEAVEAQEDSGFTGEEFEFLVALAGAGPALPFL